MATKLPADRAEPRTRWNSAPRWPVPALLSWGASWAAFRLLLLRDWPLGMAVLAAALIGLVLSLWGTSWWRKAVIAAGFPVSFALSLPVLGLGDLPAWAWLLPLVLMLLVYPVNSWADAPLFPTPAKALRALPQHAPLFAGARVLDAGCGLGHGLLALRHAYPQAQFYGLEWSATLRWLCALRLPWARISRGDIWLADWSGFDMVYLFQRPESMPRAVAKAFKELRAGAWMVSLDFEAAQLRATASYAASDGKMVWIYQAPFVYARP